MSWISIHLIVSDHGSITRLHFGAEDIHEWAQKAVLLGTLPSFEALEVSAKKLFDSYTSTHARHEARRDARDGASEWSSGVPLGTPWIAPVIDETTLPRQKSGKKLQSKDTKKSTKKKEPPPSDVPFVGDAVLDEEGAFFMDCTISREAAAASATGDVGRLYEATKVHWQFI